MKARLTAQGVTAGYEAQGTPALRDVSLEVRAGAVVGVVGPNGSGKSTLVRVLSRVLRPQGGAVRLDGRDLYNEVSPREAAQAIGVVPQSASTVLEFSVREIVEMGRAPHLPLRPLAGLGEADQAAIKAALTAAGVADMASRPVTTLSGGEWQRALLARALAQQTPVLLLDEPTAHLDIRFQYQTLMLARKLAQEQGTAVLAVLHDLNQAAEFCDWLVLMAEGRSVAQGRPSDVLTEAVLGQIYGARAWVRRHPLTGRPLVLTLPDSSAAVTPAHAGYAVHVLCGLGTGAAALHALCRTGYRVTAGVLGAGDADAEAATWLQVPFPLSAPFSPPGADALQRARGLAGEASVVVVMDVPFGPENVVGMDAVTAALRAGVSVFCVEPPGAEFAARDFTGGQATRIWNEWRAGGAVFVPDLPALLSALEQRTGTSAWKHSPSMS